MELRHKPKRWAKYIMGEIEKCSVKFDILKVHASKWREEKCKRSFRRWKDGSRSLNSKCFGHFEMRNARRQLGNDWIRNQPANSKSWTSISNLAFWNPKGGHSPIWNNFEFIQKFQVQGNIEWKSSFIHFEMGFTSTYPNWNCPRWFRRTCNFLSVWDIYDLVVIKMTN